FAHYKQGNVKLALKLTDELYALEPENRRAESNIRWYENLLQDEGVTPDDMRRNIPKTKNIRPTNNVVDVEERNKYEALCRNEVVANHTRTSKLYCYYKSDQAYLRLSPIKVEVMNLNPLVVIFRKIISDDEIRSLKTLAFPRLRRSTVQHVKTRKQMTVTNRISESTALSGENHEIVHRIDNRVELMTNLNQETAEELQVAHYGIGGHYVPHYDYTGEKAPTFPGNGDRIATTLFYLTEPEMGGATVFTALNLAISPSKNDAAFWYNVLRSGESDLRTRHAACPVLVGVKWIATKWVHEVGQEFHRPCGLNEDSDEAYTDDLGSPLHQYSVNIRSR
ncbi:hypothetical protein AB6A40_008533, partial [Gnathostoma spinigerum]